jgi:hypothetical protein
MVMCLETYIDVLESQIKILDNKNKETSERQKTIEDDAYSYFVLRNAFLPIDAKETLVGYICDLQTENEILNAELDLVPYQLEKQRELCAKTYEYWANVFSFPLDANDIPKHISSAIKNTHIPTPDDLACPIEDEAPEQEGQE